MISMIYSYLANVELVDMQKYISIALTVIDIIVSAVIIFKFFKSKGKSGPDILESVKKGISSIARLPDRRQEEVCRCRGRDRRPEGQV